MLSAIFWFFVFFVVVFAAMRLRVRMQHDEALQAWYERVLKHRINALKKIVIYGTIILWGGIWLATRGDEKASISSLLREISNSWNKQEIQKPPTMNKE